MASNVALLALLASFLLAAPQAAYSDRRGFRATMTRRTETTTTAINFTRAALKSYARLSMLAARRLGAAASAGCAQTPLQMDGGYTEYDMTISIGTPPLKLSALADTGSDLIWLKCGACKNCTPQGSPSYFPNRSSSFSPLPCSARFCRDVRGRCAGAGAGARKCHYTYRYGLGLDSHYYTQGFLGGETFTLGSGDVARGVGFGCTTSSEGYFGSGSGVVGLGRGPLSLVWQLGAGAFSYCLPSDPAKSSPLLFGPAAALSSGSGAAGIQTTPFLPNIPDDYSVDLQRITIGTAATPGPGTAGYGTAFDSGTTLTYLAEPAYTLAKAAFLNQTNLPRAAGRDGYEVCFRTSGGGGDDRVPKMTLHFHGADMVLPVENYFVEMDKGVGCWIVQKSPSLSIIGNYMQMNFHIRYDLDKAVLSFQPANCDSL
ncbi:hypothetical protein U9M48_011942 [Paspalum notatum var. saurae]|uniref:Peptidase A1 domain-containing protein n=1 Tax=Paspalum notatum var. saurae TaxID=547442 RepID=A0AAQ3SWT8_PASNO